MTEEHPEVSDEATLVEILTQQVDQVTHDLFEWRLETRPPPVYFLAFAYELATHFDDDEKAVETVADLIRELHVWVVQRDDVHGGIEYAVKTWLGRGYKLTVDTAFDPEIHRLWLYRREREKKEKDGQS